MGINDNFLSTSHEYVLHYAKEPSSKEITFLPLDDKKAAVYKYVDDVSKYKWRDFLRTGGYSTPEERPNSFYPIYFNQGTEEISTIKKEGLIEIFPLDSSGKKRVWRKTIPSLHDHIKNGDIKAEQRNGQWKILIKDRIKKEA